MATVEPASNNITTKKAKSKGALPPEERFWKRYSKHHEFPLSSAGSILLHALVFTVLIVAWAFIRGDPDKNKVEVQTLAIEPGGDLGLPGGANAPATGPAERHEAVTQPAAPLPIQGDNVPKPALTEPPKPKNDIISKSEAPDEFLPAAGTFTTQLAQADEKVSKQVQRAVQGVAAKGEGGAGKGGKGGQGGTGSSEGAGHGDGPPGKLSPRQARQSRWVMIFNTRDGEDYARQLAGLKATIALPMVGEEGQYQVIEDLRRRPVSLRKQDLREIKQIYWIDDKPESVGSLARVFGLANAPSYIVAFFPEELEKELLQKELTYRKAPEDRIEETRFMVRRNRSTGTYEPVVESQRLK
jgi:hypothetical protein